MTSEAATDGDNPAEDPYLWLEDVTGEEALDWVRARNEPTLAEFCDARFEEMRTEALEVLDTDTRIPYVVRRGEYLYNFWRDAANPRGLWRRTTLDSYRTDSPEWDVLVDVDELGRRDDEKWVWAGAGVIEPDYTRALIGLSRGGSDASIVREFDMATREFVAGGFELPEAKSQVAWADPDTVLVGTDFGGDSLTESGYPRVIKRWRRGTPLADAQTVFEGTRSDVRVFASVDRTPGFERTLLLRALDFWNDEVYELRGPELIRIDAPTDASVSIHREWISIELRTDWYFRDTVYTAGSLLAADYDEFLAGTAELRVVFEPDEHTALNHYAWTKDRLLVVTLADVASRVEIATPGTWRREPVPGIPASTNTVVVAADDTGDEFFLDSSGFVTPSRLMRGAGDGKLEPIKSAPAFFDAENLSVAQYFATSDDGASIPYFVVRPRDTDGPGPTLLSGYGGFEVARTPGYDGVLGRLWLARGGTFVMANIRGGGEYGPGWHTQAMREGRHKVAEDFAAVATDLVSRGTTTVEQLGARGGS
ncbi:MAG TPA: prolyl oligopeptidase family serine peptidase, partial [Mycobacterium sp.]|nr:prolyl oligopeptidase family serine peptidase [Mycobacterium sp.]